MRNKNLIFLIAMLVISVLLFLLRMTGLTAHIILSVLGLAVMVPLTLMTRKTWKFPAAEIAMRALYLVAIITGGMLMGGIGGIALVHKIASALFVVVLLLLYVPKVTKA